MVVHIVRCECGCSVGDKWYTNVTRRKYNLSAMHGVAAAAAERGRGGIMEATYGTGKSGHQPPR